MNKTRLTLYRNPSRRMVEFYLSQRLGDGKTVICTNIEMTTMKSEALETPPSFYMSYEDAQVFIDELWNTGFRPTNKDDSSISAQLKHLEDMRRIVFMFLDKKSDV